MLTNSIQFIYHLLKEKKAIFFSFHFYIVLHSCSPWILIEIKKKLGGRTCVLTDFMCSLFVLSLRVLRLPKDCETI